MWASPPLASHSKRDIVIALPQQSLTRLASRRREAGMWHIGSLCTLFSHISYITPHTLTLVTPCTVHRCEWLSLITDSPQPNQLSVLFWEPQHCKKTLALAVTRLSLACDICLGKKMRITYTLEQKHWSSHVVTFLALKPEKLLWFLELSV